MEKRILDLLNKAGIEEYRITFFTERTAELFFVKKQLDTRRIKDTAKYLVTVFRIEEKGGEKLKGAIDVMVLSSMSDDEIVKAFKDAYFAAQFALNPYYDAPKPVTAAPVCKTGRLAELAPEKAAGLMAEALFAADNAEGAFINSAEVFISKKSVRIVTSTGTDVSWTEAKASGEYVVQAKEPEDVEMYRHFAYNELETEELTRQVKEQLTFIHDRARAERILRSGSYDLILTGENAAEVLDFYLTRSSAYMIYPGYSRWAVGDDVQGEAIGEKIELTLRADAPYSGEGIPMIDRKLFESGEMKLAHGGARFCGYLGLEPTGDYSSFSCDNAGSMSFEEMKKRPCLWAVTFSDFQMDSFSGHFGGEIRLAYLIDGEKAIPVTGGSINGSILEAQKDIVFSADRFKSEHYSGPYAMMLRGVSVAGTDAE
ncbi:MAG: hypothetical protein II072_06250 [Clostridia bacterium]|nr:hypothetical protein [Clostridia bacterium]MBQ5487366.1 hypothetical protein [Clostridia bacterium]